MHYLTLAMILAVTLANYFATVLKVLPDPLKFLPEFMSVLVALYVIAAGMVQRFKFVRSAYLLVFGAIAMTMLCGIIANEVQPGPLIAGLRAYLRAIPLFFLPAVYPFKDWQIRRQLQLLLGVSLLQLPLAVSQRLTLFGTKHWSGDQVFGTLLISSVLSMFLICAACVATGLFLRKRLSKLTFVLIFFLILIPTTINETKGTLLLLPAALLTTLIVGAPRNRRLGIGLAAVALIASFGAIYVPVYNYFAQHNNPYPTTLADFFTEKGRMERYLEKGTGPGTREDVGRIDAVMVPLREFSDDPVRLAFGFGIGNASHSALGTQFVGRYYSAFGPYATVTSAGAFLLEIGVLGTSLVGLLYLLVFNDARAVARGHSGLVGAIAIGWTGITVLMAIATFYKSIHSFESLSYLFWYFSGVIAAERVRLASSQVDSLPAVEPSALNVRKPLAARTGGAL